MKFKDVESYIFSVKPSAFVEDGVLLPKDLAEWIDAKFSLCDNYVDAVLCDFRCDLFVLADSNSRLLDNVRAECLTSGSLMIVIADVDFTEVSNDSLFRVERVECDGYQISVFIPRILVVNKVASYAYRDGTHLEWPFPAIVPRSENKELIKCAEITDSKISGEENVSRARAVNQFYEALKSQYAQVPFDFSFCAIGMPLPISEDLKIRLSDIFFTGILVDTSREAEYQSWNPDWLPRFMADGSTTYEITKSNSESIKDFLIRKQPAFERLKNDYVITSIVIGTYVPVFAGCCAVAGFFLCPKNGTPVNNWIYLIKHCHSCLNLFVLDDARHRFQASAMKSAIGSIMSRNGSHNIGSHVLAALSHNVGTMPDDRVLYQYIQHRMDYIATATTDRPAWTMPTKFVSSMMRRFLSQRHLLDYVSRSEGLKAYQFQNPHEDTSSLECQPGTIRLHVRRIGDDDMQWNRENLFLTEMPVEDFIDYPKGTTSHLDKDVEAAIPGGVVGQHAFFTILENILRNAAKHEWAVLQEECKNVVEMGSRSVIVTQPGLATIGTGVQDAKQIYYGTPTGVLNDTRFSVVGKKIISVLQTIVDGEGNDVNDQFLFTDYTVDQSNSETGKVKLETKKYTPIGSYKVTLTAECSDGTKVRGDVLSFVVRPPHLDLYIDFQDRPKEGKVNVVIWSNCGGRSFDEEACYLSTSEIEERLESESSLGELKLDGLSPLQRLQVKMARPFIAADGHLYRENWGLAEMRISAGYLNVSKIEDIGGISKSAKRFSIIRPVVVETADKDKEQTGKRHCLGYFFSIPKPKELLVILPDSMIPEGKTDQIKSQTDSFSAELKRFGVELAFESSLEALSESNAALSFSYVLFKGKPSVLDKLKLGYRLLGAPGIPAWDGAQYTGTLFKRRIQDILSSDPESFVNDLLKGIYVDWMKFVKAQFRGKDLEKRKAMDFPLVIDVYGQKSDTASGMQSKDAEQSLISDVELLDFIFKNTFNSAVDSYLASISTRNKTVRHGLALWRSPGKREVLVEPTRPSISEDGGVIAGEVVQLTRSEMIRRQLGTWCDRDYPSEEDRLCMQTMKSWLKALDVDSLDMDVPRELKDFIDYIGGIIFDQAKAFLCKYEERYVTLPEAMEVKLSASTEKTCSVGDQRVVFTSKDDRKNSPSFANAIAYWRHENYKTERKNHPVYLEALSGAQSYFSVFSELGQSANDGTGEDLNREDTGLVAKLVECGLFKVLIVDERVSRFVAEHEDVKKAFSHIGIDVLDADSSKTIEMFKAQQSLALVEYDIAIVHQGIIDKRLHDSGALADVDAFCRRMEENVPFFAITTGRGTPSTIPPNARVLPFSVVESTLFTRYPEKFILVDTIMNLLPIGGQEAQ